MHSLHPTAVFSTSQFRPCVMAIYRGLPTVPILLVISLVLQDLRVLSQQGSSCVGPPHDVRTYIGTWETMTTATHHRDHPDRDHLSTSPVAVLVYTLVAPWASALWLARGTALAN